MVVENDKHSKMKRKSSNDSWLLHFYEVNQSHCNDKASNEEVIFEARVENVDNFNT